MARSRAISLAAFLAVAGIIGILASIRFTGPALQGPRQASVAGPPAEPEVILRDVAMREIRKEGVQYRLVSEQADYLILTGRFSASGVTLELPGAAGDVVVRAPKASWNMATGHIFLPEGGSARTDAGWSAVLAATDLSLPDQLLTAAGMARLSGPGLSVVGDNLVWRWREGKVALELPKTRIEPKRTLRGGG
jgi:hypothetical protein